MTSLFGIGIAKSIMFFLAYTILLLPLLSFTNAEIGRRSAALPISHHVTHDVKIQVEELIPPTDPSIYHHHQAHNLSARADPALYAQRTLKGRQLYCTMQDSLELTTYKNGGVSQEADISNPESLYSEGYRAFELYEGEHEVYPFFADSLDEPLALLGVPRWTPGPGMPVYLAQDHTAVGMSLEEGGDMLSRVRTMRTVQPTQASFRNLYYCNPGLIVADYNTSPAASGAIKDAPTSPRIWTWSDAAFLNYKKTCDDDFSHFNWVIRAGIVNPDTNMMTKMALRAYGRTEVPTWGNRITLRPTDDPFYPILGSKNGAGVAFLLTTHKGVDVGMGVKTVTSITIWTYNSQAQSLADESVDEYSAGICLLFHITDVASPNTHMGNPSV